MVFNQGGTGTSISPWVGVKEGAARELTPGLGGPPYHPGNARRISKPHQSRSPRRTCKQEVEGGESEIKLRTDKKLAKGQGGNSGPSIVENIGMSAYDMHTTSLLRAHSNVRDDSTEWRGKDVMVLPWTVDLKIRSGMVQEVISRRTRDCCLAQITFLHQLVDLVIVGFLIINIDIGDDLNLAMIRTSEVGSTFRHFDTDYPS